MTRFIDLTQTFENGMPGFRMCDKAGQATEFTARIHPFLTHEESKPNYGGNASFEITEVHFQTSIGTYLDAPRHRHEGMGDIASLEISSLISHGIVIDARGCSPNTPLTAEDLPRADTLAGRAVLINFGWDRHWGAEEYYNFPYVDRRGLQHLLDSEISLFGVDALNADCPKDLERPAHTWFLKNNIHIVENLTGLEQLHGQAFRFFAIPLKVRGAAAFPIRAFAEIE
ncbi:cyclase [Roseibium algicola]|uniref:Cyclase n=1 Tax=Roseibium algicola TaxID=2857014 RepID=A0ABN4X8C1_9HYPH|nr:cyclase family protein [Roseibium aggregatum]AQQ07512.1 cyclase [Roseibium aggregatum]